MKKYDYIFIGAGCAALSLLMRMINGSLLVGKQVLVIDKETKKKNDRTWCFWEKEAGFFEPVVCKQWNSMWFYGENFSKQLAIAPYSYKMIRGIDFYNYCFDTIRQQPAIDILYGDISDVSFDDSRIQFKIGNKPYGFKDAVVFNSIPNEKEIAKQKPVQLLQHFKGWIVETAAPFFNPAEATLMDFRVAQTNGTTFVYVLPLSSTKALVEYTLFSEKILPDNIYNDGLKQYLQQYLQLTTYKIAEEEFGIIPMTDAKFPWYANGMYHIGAAGGQTKASSGYTFQFIQKQSAAIVKQLSDKTFDSQTKPAAFSKRFNFYDAVLLRVLAGKYARGSSVFTSLFKNNQPAAIFTFLDNESSFVQDLSIIQSLPALPFLKGAYKKIVSL